MTTPEHQEVEGGMTEDQAAQSLLDKWAPQDDDDPKESTEAEPTEEAEAEQTDEVDAQADDDTEEEAEESDDSETVNLLGEDFKFTKEVAPEVKRLAAKVKEMEAGSTRKFQEAAEVQRVAAAEYERATRLRAAVDANRPLVAQLAFMDHRLNELSQINVRELAQTDPVRLTEINAEMNNILFSRPKVQAQFDSAVQQIDQLEEQAIADKMPRLVEYAQRNIKGWSAKYNQEIEQFAVRELGFSDRKALLKILDIPMLKAIDLAYQGHKVRTADPKAKQLLNTKTLKPGSAVQAKTTAHQSYEKARKQLSKSGSTEDAAMALLARARIRKR
jgi:hypothetical protein